MVSHRWFLTAGLSFRRTSTNECHGSNTTPLRRMTNGESKVEMESSNLGELVEKLDGAYPGFKDRLVDENGELRYFVNIYVNGEDVRLSLIHI